MRDVGWRGIRYSEIEDGISITPHLNEGALRLEDALLDFCRGIGASYFDAEFFGEIRMENSAYSRILQKAVHVLPLSGEESEGGGRIYQLRSKFSIKFLKRFMKDYWWVADVTIFNNKHEKIMMFSKENEYYLYNFSDKMLSDLKKRLKPFEENTDYWKKIVIDLDVGEGNEPVSAEVYRKHHIASPNFHLWVELLSSDVVWGKRIRKVIKDFDFSIFDAMLASLSDPKATYKRIWKPDDILKRFGELEEKVKKNDKMLPKYYWVWGLSRMGNGKLEWCRWNDMTLKVGSAEWRFRTGPGKAVARSSTGKKTDLIKDDSVFKLGKEYAASNVAKYYPQEHGVRKFKITPTSFYEQHQFILSRIRDTCKYAKEHGYKIYMALGA